jgi:catechol 2,3-dioxygenase-like lactoylglutathione lyase family enzyme
MQQQISVITLGIAEIARSKRFYVDGFGWKPVLDTPDIVFYQMNGLMLGTWLASALRPTVAAPGRRRAPSAWRTTCQPQPTCSR